MDTLSLDRVERLLWLGRYVERSYTTLQFVWSAYDAALDDAEGPWREQLEELGFDQEKDDPIAFFDQCLFDMDSPVSIARSLNAAFDNAVVLRDVIGTESVAYVQMACDEIARTPLSDAPLLELQAIVDSILAFKGSCDDFVSNDAARNIIKCGFSIERMDLYVRLGYHLQDVRKEARKLASRIDRTGLPYDRMAFKELINRVFAPEFPQKTTYGDLGEMLTLMARVF